MNKKYFIILIFGIFIFGCANVREGHLYQNAVFSSFASGNFESNRTVKEIQDHGDFGIGTLNGLDGEMVGLDGDFYQVKSDGKVYPVKSEAKSPFAEVVFFEPDKILFPGWNLDYAAICDYLDKNIPAKDKFYAIKIQGKFKSVKARSVPQQNKPYPTLNDALVNQVVFNYEKIEGTLVGFRFPQYMDNINIPGYHFHFLSKDKLKGGHLLDCSVNEVSIEIDELNKFDMELLG